MKLFPKALIFFLLMLSLSACKKDGDQPQDVDLLYEEQCTPSSSFHFGLSDLNGLWCADFEILSDLRNQLYIRAESQNGIVVEAFLKDFVNGTYTIDGERNRIVINRFGNIYQSYNDISGNLTILEYSPAQDIVGANFQFTAINYNSFQTQFVEGSFRIRF